MKVNEIFLSIQGEGISTGYPTIFVRFTGCNLRCTYCDTKYSYDEGTEMSIEEIYSKIKELKYKRVCITGGEPLLQEGIEELLSLLNDYEVNIETNGSVYLNKLKLSDNHRFTMDMKVPSSMESKKMVFENFNYLRGNDEIKFVIGTREDYEWSKQLIMNYYKKGNIIFSPIFNKIDSKEIINWILEDELDVRFQLQIHKVIWDPSEKGV